MNRDKEETIGTYGKKICAYNMNISIYANDCNSTEPNYAKRDKNIRYLL